MIQKKILDYELQILLNIKYDEIPIGNNKKDFNLWVQFPLSLVGGGHKLIIQYTLRYCRPTKHSLPLTKLTNQSSEWKVG